MAYKYSKNFLKLLEVEGDCLVRDSFYSGSFYAWEKARFPITKAVNKGGTILDIGCANGFLLKCLIEWCSYTLVPFGYDNNRSLINKAKKIFPKYKKNFITQDMFHTTRFEKYGWPKKFDFIYWNVWDSFDFVKIKNLELIFRLYEMVNIGGRLILGFYDSDQNKIKKIKVLFRKRILLSGVSTGLNEIIVWLNK